MSNSRDHRERENCLIGRADLLLVLSGLNVETIDSSETGLSDVLGFGVSQSARKVEVDRTVSVSEAADYSHPQADDHELGKTAEDIGIWVCSACQPLTDEPTPHLAVSPVNQPEWHREREKQPALVKRLSFSSLLNTWDQVCSDSLPGHQMDLLKAVNLCAEAKPFLELPRRRRKALPSEVVLIIDCRPQLFTLLNEQILIIQHLHQMLGESLHVVEMREPPEFFLDEFKNLQSERSKQIPVTAAVLVLSDFDVFSRDANAVIDAGWIRTMSHLLDRGNRVVTLGAGVVQLDSRARHIGILGETTTEENINRVMASMVRLHLAKPDRIRSLIAALGIPAKVSLATENAIWNHVDRDFSLPNQWIFKEGRRNYWLRKYDSFPVEDREVIDIEVERWRSSLHLGHAGVEYLIDGWAGIGNGPNGAIFDRAMAVRAMVEQGGGRFDSWLFTIHSVMQEVAEVYAERDDLKHLLKAVQVHAAEHRLSQPLGLQFLSSDENKQISFHQIGPGIHVINDSTTPSVWTTTSLCLYQHSQKTVRHGDQFVGQELQLQSSTHNACLTFLTHPSWAISVERDSSGTVRASHQDNVVFTYESASESRQAGTWKLASNQWTWAKSVGVDAYGLWAEFTVNQVAQRLRWISPGEFQMGSPENEPRMADDETLHHVTLTEGYWLADTTCTQALWKAVMGSNPSIFRGADRPVEDVNWNEIKDFIVQLSKKVPGLQIKLPTEAQWEYAVRAGSQSAFWWGSTLSPEQANYRDIPYADGKGGQYGKGTLPVKEFEPNPWGLYQVHGNVWEQCADWYGAYESNAVVNPRGAKSGRGRVCRGGSWNSFGGRLRAAYRDVNVPGDRVSNLGFRLCAGQSGAEPR